MPRYEIRTEYRVFVEETVEAEDEDAAKEILWDRDPLRPQNGRVQIRDQLHREIVQVED